MGNLYTGTSGADTLRETTLKGDTLVGGAGDDTYHARAGSYWVSGFPEYGIPGHTEYYRTDVVEQAGGGIDTVHYSIGILNITVGAAELANIERIYLVNGFAGLQDIGFRLQLGNGAQTVFGSNAHETIDGGAGIDSLVGGAGNDTLTGGDGYDTYTGGSGVDHFRFHTVASATSGSVRDLIVDFVSGQDRINLSAIDANPALAGNQAFTVEQLQYDPGTGVLYADAGNDGSWGVQIQLGLVLHPQALLVADIVL